MAVKGAIVISGASTGIGRACALALEGRGYRVFAGVRTDEADRELRRVASQRLTPVRLDVTDEHSIREVAATVAGTASDGPLVGLVNNAGITVNGPLEFLSPDDLRRQLEVNLVGHLVAIQAFLPQLRRDRGRIVNVGSVSGFIASPLLGPYCMSKYAMEAMSDALRLELAPSGVHVAHLQPGSIATPIWEKGRRDAARYVEDAPAELTERYGSLMQAVLRQVDRMERSAASVDVVVRDVLHALTSPRPRPRYTMGANVLAQRILANLPTRWRDRLLVRLLRISD